VYNKTIRPYEMSVWTLQDRYIATLKVPDIENKGHIEDPKITLNVDGTQELEFKVPMYYSVNGELVENPRWYDVQHGLLMRGLRKIKVRFIEENKVFEFLVTDVEEEHDSNDSLYCSVKGSGLAFQELGKKGYKISLSPDDYLMYYEEYEDTMYENAKKFGWSAQTLQTKLAEKQLNNINFWCDKVFATSDWTYSIQMEWSDFDGYVYKRITDPRKGILGIIGVGMIDKAKILEDYNNFPGAFVGIAEVNYALINDAGDMPLKMEYISYSELLDVEKEAVNDLRESLGLRRNDKIYEDEYVTSWRPNEEKHILEPIEYQKYREKCRNVEASESNIYNITQTIAETFEVYCKYEYHYDENFHIIKKEVIFYNNFSDEMNGTIDLTYPYNSTSIKRTMDNNDLCTKLFVPSIEDGSAPDGVFSIMNTAANPSGEDYILNFDYLYMTDSIDRDQYEAISSYEYDMKYFNNEIKNRQEQQIKLEDELIEQQATQTIANNSKIQALDQISRAKSGLQDLTKNESGAIEGYETYGVIQKRTLEENSPTEYYIKLNDKGILDDGHFKAFRRKNASGTFDDEISSSCYHFSEDENGNINGLKDLKLLENEKTAYTVWYFRYNMRPQIYYQNIINTYAVKYNNEDNRYNTATERIGDLETEIERLEAELEQLFAEKEAEVADFDKMMGPALREGNWRPDDYQDYGDKYSKLIEITPSTISDNSFFIWDTTSFEGEPLGYYEEGVNLERVYYPCVDISNYLSAIEECINRVDNSVAQKTLCYKYEEEIAATAISSLEDGTYFYVYNDVDISSVDMITGSSQEAVEIAVVNKMLKKETGETINGIEYASDDLINFIRVKYGLSYTLNHYFELDGNMHLGFLKDSEDVVKPVLVLDGVEDIGIPYGKTLEEFITHNAELCTVDFDVVVPGETSSAALSEYSDTNNALKDVVFSNYIGTKVYERINTLQEITSDDLIFNYGAGSQPLYEYVYPRFKINSLSLKTSSDQLSIKSLNDDVVAMGQTELKEYKDFDILIRDNNYFLTLSPQCLIEQGNFEKQFQVDYVLSNAELHIYLDAREVLKSNSRPQVSYEIDVSIVNEDFIKTAYRQLNRLAHINDHELKFENVMGYVSNIEMDLDHPWEDSIEIKNYKTKFEDLFTKIVAATESMKANETIYNKAASAFDSTGQIKTEIIGESLKGVPLNIEMVEGNLTIDSTEGIQAISDEGIVMMSGGGIYCATDQENGNWIWNAGITPSGINASLIKAGQLDTNLVRIFSGNNLAFQMNSDGLFAYREPISTGGLESEYVVHNGEGLFLVNKDIEVDGEIQDINRVEVSWNGFIIRNLNNEEVFYADDEGNLTLAGTIEAADGLIGGWLIKENTLMSNPDEAEDSNVKSTGMASGSFIDEETGITNILNESTDLYKVFWVGDETDRNHFYVDSTGVVNATSIIVDNSLIASKIVLDGILLNDVIKEVRENAGSISVVNLTSDTFYYTDGDEPDEDELRFALVSSTGIELTESGGLSFYYLQTVEEEDEEPEPEPESDEEEEETEGEEEEEEPEEEEEEESEEEESEEETEDEEYTETEEWVYLPLEDYGTIEDIVNDHYLTFSINSDIISLMEEDSNTLTLKAVYTNYECTFSIYVRDERGSKVKQVGSRNYLLDSRTLESYVITTIDTVSTPGEETICGTVVCNTEGS